MESLYQAAFEIWNQGIIIAITLFTTSPTSAAGGSLYSVAHSVYSTLASIAVPIATIFFLIAIIKDVVMTPPDQQIRRFFGDALRFGIMIGILANLWEIMGVVIEVTDGITNAIFPATSGGDTMLSMSADLQNLINQAKILDPSPTIAGSGGFINWVGDMKDWCTTSLSEYMTKNFYLLLGGLITLITTIAALVAIISCAFQRIIKPLIIMPFASITVAMGSGGGEASRVMTSYLKTFFGFCLSGAFMVICIKLGAQLMTHIIYHATGGLLADTIIMSVQTAAVPLVTAGLIKAIDSVIARFF